MTHVRVPTMAPARAAGFSLIELMIALAAGLVVSTAAVAFLMSSFKSNAEYVQSTRLTQELRNTLDLLVRDLQRAGYDDDALAYVGNTNTSPFTPILISGNCVIYAYDRTFPNGTATATGVLGAGSIDLENQEVRGLRLSSANVNGNTVGVIEYAESTTGTRPDCSDATADYSAFPFTCVGTWCPLSDASKLDITAFTIVNNGTSLPSVSPTMALRRLDIELTGRIAGTTDFTRNVRSSVKVRADCLRVAANFSECSATP